MFFVMTNINIKQIPKFYHAFIILKKQMFFTYVQKQRCRLLLLIYYFCLLPVLAIGGYFGEPRGIKGCYDVTQYVSWCFQMFVYFGYIFYWLVFHAPTTQHRGGRNMCTNKPLVIIWFQFYMMTSKFLPYIRIKGISCEYA